MKTAYLKKVVSNIVPVLASVCWMRSVYHTTIFCIAIFIRKIPINGVPKMLLYRKYIQNPSPDKGKWRQFYYEAVFRWNILLKYSAS